MTLVSGDAFTLRNHPSETPMMIPAKISSSGLRLTHDFPRNKVGRHSYFRKRDPAAIKNPIALPHLAHHIDQRRLAAFYYFDRLAECLDQIFRFDDRTGAPATVRPRHGAEVDVRVFDPNANGF